MSSTQKAIKWCAIGFAALLAVSIISGILSCIVSIGTSFIPDKKEHRAEGTAILKEDYNSSFSGIEEIDIDSGIGAVTFVVDNKIEDVKVVTEGADHRYNVKQDNETLVVEETEFRIGKLISKGKTSKCKVRISVPTEKVLKKVDIDAGVGSISISDVKTKELDIDGGVGDLTCNNVVAEDVDINGGVGSVKINDVEFARADIEGGVGTVNFRGKITESGSLSSGMGSMKLKIDGRKNDYSISVDSGIGAVKINGQKCGDVDLHDSDSRKTLNIEGGVGSVDVDFME